jgi:hypothetical protein
VSSAIGSWSVSGSYFEACNCTAICPCRVVGDRPGGRSTHGTCRFVLSWQVREGQADGLSLDGLGVVMAGEYDDDEPSSPWTVSLYVDERADDEQLQALSDIFLGRAGGGTFDNFASAIATVHNVRRAAISLTHQRRRWRIRASGYISVSASREVAAPGPVACGIPGLDRPGQEVVSDELLVTDGPLAWDFRERCGFATDFRYASAGAGS